MEQVASYMHPENQKRMEQVAAVNGAFLYPAERRGGQLPTKMWVSYVMGVIRTVFRSLLLLLPLLLCSCRRLKSGDACF